MKTFRLDFYCELVYIQKEGQLIVGGMGVPVV
jgi:hypothetical protein